MAGLAIPDAAELAVALVTAASLGGADAAVEVTKILGEYDTEDVRVIASVLAGFCWGLINGMERRQGMERGSMLPVLALRCHEVGRRPAG